MSELAIIIPHHNCSKMFERLLQTIPSFDYYQVIVVDDNSTEAEFNNVEALSKKYKFELYKNEGKCAGGARNTGLKHVQSPWVMFVDADDYLTPCFDDSIKRHIPSNCDIVFFSVTSCYDDTGEKAYRHSHVHSLFARYNDSKDDNVFRCCYLSPVAKMIKNSLIQKHNILFEEIPAGNDMWFSANTGVLADTIEADDSEIYMITVSKGSTTTTLSKDRFDSRFEATLRTNLFLRSHGKSKYQISVLYFIGKANQFGAKYLMHVLARCIKMGSNLTVGLGKLLHIKEVMQDRQNKKYTIVK